MFVVGSNDCKARYQAEKAARVLGTRGIASTHFFEDYRNDAPYVTKRVQEALQATAGAPSAAQTEGEPVVLEVLSKKNRPGMAWGTAKCRIRQGKVESGAPYYGHINSLTGQQIRLGSMTYDDATEGGEVTMLLYCDKTLLASIKTLYVFPVGEYDDGDVD